jgi:arylsulfatase A-like enzyme
LLARRLIEAGVSFVEIFHRGWDDHEGAAKRISARAPWMDAGMATLIRDLKRRGMLDDTLIVWMGEFGRSPGDGGGHFCNAWSTVWAGGGIKTGQVVGKTSDTGKNAGGTVTERPISAPDYVATLCLALGIDIHQEFMAPGNRPMPLAEKTAKPIAELLK